MIGKIAAVPIDKNAAAPIGKIAAVPEDDDVNVVKSSSAAAMPKLLREDEIIGVSSADAGFKIVTRLLISKNRMGTLIGKGGINITEIRRTSGAKVLVNDTELGEDLRIVVISGEPQQVMIAYDMAVDRMIRIHEGHVTPENPFVMHILVDQALAGKVIGKDGSGFKEMKSGVNPFSLTMHKEGVKLTGVALRKLVIEGTTDMCCAIHQNYHYLVNGRVMSNANLRKGRMGGGRGSSRSRSRERDGGRREVARRRSRSRSVDRDSRTRDRNNSRRSRSRSQSFERNDRSDRSYAAPPPREKKNFQQQFQVAAGGASVLPPQSQPPQQQQQQPRSIHQNKVDVPLGNLIGFQCGSSTLGAETVSQLQVMQTWLKESFNLDLSVSQQLESVAPNPISIPVQQQQLYATQQQQNVQYAPAPPPNQQNISQQYTGQYRQNSNQSVPQQQQVGQQKQQYSSHPNSNMAYAPQNKIYRS